VASAPASELARLKKVAYQAIAGVAVLGLAAFLLFIVGSLPSTAWTTGTWPARLVPILIISTVVLLTITTAMFASRGRYAAAVSAGGLIAWSGLQVGWILIAKPPEPIPALIAAFMALVVGVFVAEGVVANVARLQRRPVTVDVRVVAAVAGVASGSTILWLIASSLVLDGQPTHVIASLGPLVVAVAAVEVLPYLAARSVQLHQPTKKYVPATPLAGVLQDCFVSLLLAVFVGWLPTLVLVHVHDVTTWISPVLVYSGFLSSAYIYVMGNNVRHVRSEFEKAKRAAGAAPIPADQLMVLQALRTHCRRQNLIGLIALVPLLIVAAVALAIELFGFRPGSGFRSFLRDILVDSEP
jgi:hypothetical protein